MTLKILYKLESDSEQSESAEEEESEEEIEESEEGQSEGKRLNQTSPFIKKFDVVKSAKTTKARTFIIFIVISRHTHNYKFGRILKLIAFKCLI